MHTASEGFTARISTIRFIGTVGITILMFTIPTIHGIRLHGQCRGTGDGDIAGIHLTAGGGMVIRPITATGTDLIMEWAILTIVRGTDMAATTEDITTGAGMLIRMTTVMEEGHQAQRMYDTETGQTVIWPELRHAHHPQKVHAMKTRDVQLPTVHTPNAEVHRVQA